MMISGPAFLDALREHKLLDEDQLARLGTELPPGLIEPRPLADQLCARGLLTAFQADHLLRGRAADLVLGPYLLLDKLGEGGMGTVLKALHRKLKAVRAVKLIRPDALTSKLAVDRFYRESQAVASLKHPNIIVAHDVNQDGDRHYFVMEYAPGCDLGKLLQQRGPLPLAEACEYVRQAALGLQHAHERGLVHRDIKPSNLLLSTEEGLIKILDLGLARLREAVAEAEDGICPITPNGMMMGTPDYMAPEQAENSSGVDTRADIYSLGCSLYQLVSGSVPFPGGSLADKLRRHYAEKPTPLSQKRADVPEALSAVVARMMAKLPEQRYQVPAQAAEALQSFSGAIGPGGASGRRSCTDGGDSRTPVIPPTLELPKVPRRTATERGSADDDCPTEQVGRRRSPASPARWSAGEWLVVALILLAIGKVGATFLSAIFLDWGGFGDHNYSTGQADAGPPPSPAREAPAPVKERPASPPVQPRRPDDRGNQLPQPPKPPASPAPLPEPKGRGKGASAAETQAAGTSKSGGGGAHAARERQWRRVEVVREWAGRPARVTFAAGGSRVAVVNRSTVELHATDGQAKAKFVSPVGLLGNRVTVNAPVAVAALSADGGRVVFATLSSTDRRVGRVRRLDNVYDTLVEWDGHRLRLFYGDLGMAEQGKLRPSTQCLAYSADGKLLLAGSGMRLRLWDLRRDREHNDSPLAVLEVGAQMECVACAPSGAHVLVGTRDNRLRLFRLAAEASGASCDLTGQDRMVRCAAFVSETQVVSGDSAGVLLVWDVRGIAGETGPIAPLHRLEGWHVKAVTCVTASARGDYFATGGADGIVCLGKIGAKQPVWKEPSGGAEVKAVAFAADGKHVLFATEKGLGRIPLQTLTEGEGR